MYIGFQVGTNGVISFEDPWAFWYPETFPTSFQATREAFVVAPFWADHDIRLEGEVSYQTYTFGDSDSNAALEYVSAFVRSRSNTAGNFTGRWMLVAQWTDVHPYPHGNSFVGPAYQEFIENVSKPLHHHNAARFPSTSMHA